MYTLNPVSIGSFFARYELLLEKTVGRTVSQRRITTVKTTGAMRNLDKAKYRIAFRLVGTNGQRSRNSAYSSPMQVRQSSRR